MLFITKMIFSVDLLFIEAWDWHHSNTAVAKFIRSTDPGFEGKFRPKSKLDYDRIAKGYLLNLCVFVIVCI